MSDTSKFEDILKWIVLAILVVVALKVVAWVLGVAFFLGGFLLFRILPLVVVVWLVLKAVEWTGGKKSGSSGPTTADGL